MGERQSESRAWERQISGGGGGEEWADRIIATQGQISMSGLLAAKARDLICDHEGREDRTPSFTG